MRIICVAICCCAFAFFLSGLLDVYEGARYMVTGSCLLWRADLVIPLVLSDLGTSLAYMLAIPFAAWKVVKKGGGWLHNDVVPLIDLALAVGFIAACGIAHQVDNVNVFVAIPHTRVTAHSILAVVSVTAAVRLIYQIDHYAALWRGVRLAVLYPGNHNPKKG